MSETTVSPAELSAALYPVLSRVRTDICAMALKGKGAMLVDRHLTHELLISHHFTDRARVGAYPMCPGDDTTRIAVLDFDSHKGETSWGDMLDVVYSVDALLRDKGGRPVLFRSSGGQGVHLYLIWDAPQDAYSVRTFLADALIECGLKSGTGGVSSREVEVFPKQSSLNAEGKRSVGNMFILPLAGESAPIEFGLVLPKEEIIGVEWATSADIAKIESEPKVLKKLSSIPSSLKKLEEALEAIPPECADDYHKWLTIMMAIHAATGGSSAGLDLAHKFSSRLPDYDPEELDNEKWPSFDDQVEGGVTENTIYAIARQNGWVSIDEFEVIETPVPDLDPYADAEYPPFERDQRKASFNKILATIQNILLALRAPNICHCRIRYDQFRDQLVIEQKGTSQWRPFKDSDYTELRRRLEFNIGFLPIGKEMIRDAVILVSEENEFDSAIQWVESLKWDGVPRVENFMRDYMCTEDSPYARSTGLYLWTALAGRALEPGCQADMALVLVGKQGLHKSTAVANIAPTPECFAEVDLGMKEADMSRNLRGVLVAEISELRGLRTKEMTAIKAFITRRIEKWTPKYIEFSTNFLRRTIFIGTSNEEEILADDTGERRWLPINVGNILAGNIKRDRDQLWAEGAVLFLLGGVQYKEAEELAEKVRETFTVEDSWEATISDWLDGVDDDFDNDSGKNRMTKGVTIEAISRIPLNLPPEKTNHITRKRILSVVKKLGMESLATRTNEGKIVKLWRKRVVT